MDRIVFVLLCFVFSGFMWAQRPAEEEPLYKKAQKLQEKGHYEKSSETLQFLFDQGKVEPEYLMLHITNLIALDNFKEAFGLLNTSIQRFPKSVKLLQMKALILYEMGRFGEEAEVWTQTLEVVSGDTLFHYFLGNRGMAYFRSGKVKKAELDLRKAYAFDSTDVDIVSNMVQLEFRLGNTAEGKRLLNKAYAMAPEEYVTLNNMGLYLQKEGAYEASIQWLERALKLNAKEAYGWSNQAFNYYKTGDLKKAEKYIEKSLKLDPGNSWAYKNKGLILQAKGQTQEACRQFDIALELGYTNQYGDEVQKLKQEYCN